MKGREKLQNEEKQNNKMELRELTKSQEKVTHGCASGCKLNINVLRGIQSEKILMV